MSSVKTKTLTAAIALAGLISVPGLAQTATSRAGLSRAASWNIASLDMSDPATGVSSSSSGSDALDSAKIVAVPQPLPVKKATEDTGRVLPFSRIAIGTKMGTLGYGGQIATPITGWLNLRGGVEVFNFGYGLVNDGTSYNASLHLKSGSISADYFPFRRSSFHVSPGILIFKSTLTASMFVPGGSNFSENDVDYTSDPSDPVKGTGNVLFQRSIMPALTFGFGNMITRRENRHWSVPFEIGAAYAGHYNVNFNLSGSACNTYGCMSVSDPSIQQNVALQQAKINEEAKRYQIYPIVSSGVAYRF
jgi:hypothetical protein